VLAATNIDLALANVVSERWLRKTPTRQPPTESLYNCRVARRSCSNRVPGTRIQAATFWAWALGLSAAHQATLCARYRPRLRRASCQTCQHRVPVSAAPPAWQESVALRRVPLPRQARAISRRGRPSQHGAVRRGPSGLACPKPTFCSTEGASNAALVRSRITGLDSGWRKKAWTGEAAGRRDLMHAGLARPTYYGLARAAGLRIRGGIPRT